MASQAQADIDPRHSLGARGEELAADFFIKRGFTVVARNWKCPQGELDLVIRKGEELRIIEVKTRQGSGGPVGPFESVTGAKLSRIAEAAARFLDAHPMLPEDAHVDVLCVTFTTAGVPVFQWLPDFE